MSSLHAPVLPRSPLAWAGFAVLAVGFALAAYALTSHALAQDVGVDAAGYYDAAERLRNGEPLYAGGAANASDRYRYAPWFAAAWIPLTLLDRDLAVGGWVILMLVAAAVSTVPLLGRGWAGVALFLILAPLQLQGAVFGNVQPLLVLALMHGVERRSGPLWIALGASLKAVPLLLAVVYAGRGEWRRAAVAAGLTAVLVAPLLLFDLTGYSVEPGPNQMSLAAVWFPAFVAVAAVAAIATFALARSRYGWLAASVAMLAALPRLLSYELGFLLVGTNERPGDNRTPNSGP
jgi:hypothetical protein